MNILLINHYAGSNQYGMEYRPFYLAREWVIIGHHVTVVSASFSHLRSKNPEMKGRFREEDVEGIRYFWIKTPLYRGNGIKRVINIITFVLKLFLLRKRIIQDFKPDIVIASSTYPLDIYPAASFARKNKAKLIFEVHDLWPLSPIELGGMSPNHPFIVLMQWTENYAYRVSDYVVSLLPKAKLHMIEHGLHPDKFVYIPNGICIDEWQNDKVLPAEHQQVLSKLKEQNQFIIGYAGAHGLANALHAFIKAAALLKSEPVTFVLVGQGPEKKALVTKKDNLNLDNVIFLPPVSRSSIPALLEYMDVLYIGLQNQSLFRFGVSPNKLMDYMMAGKPVIYAIQAGNDMVAESGCGVSIPPENPEEIAKAVKQLMRLSAEERLNMGLKGRKFIIEKHNYEGLAKDFLEIMKRK